MKIIISPSKSMNLSNGVEKNIKFKDFTYKIVDEIKKLSLKELQKKFKLSDRLSLEMYNYYQNFENNKCYRAIDLYNGGVYKNLNIKEKEFFNEHVIILSALYGPIKPNDYIKPYRLDFSKGIKLDGIWHKTVMRDVFNDYFINNLKEGELIINLASFEFAQLLNNNGFDFLLIDFYEFFEGEYYCDSAFLKAARAEMISHICNHKITTIKDLFNSHLKNLVLDKTCIERHQCHYINFL